MRRCTIHSLNNGVKSYRDAHRFVEKPQTGARFLILRCSFIFWIFKFWDVFYFKGKEVTGSEVFFLYFTGEIP